MYFTKGGARQTPSYPIEFTKKCDGKTKKFRSEGVEGQFKRRVTRKPQRFDKDKPDMEPWKAVTKATLNFRLPAKTATNVTWTVPKDGQSKGQCRFRPSTLALSEMKHFMGVANVDRPHATSGPGEYGLILPKAAMKRVIMELGIKRKENICFESGSTSSPSPTPPLYSMLLFTTERDSHLSGTCLGWNSSLLGGIEIRIV